MTHTYKVVNLDLNPIIKSILEELGVEEISNLLLEYFLKVVSKQYIIRRDIETPGLPTLTAFEEFGDICINKYIRSKYVKYLKDIKKGIKDISLNHYKVLNVESLKVFEYYNINTLIGGSFM